jgi:hypothetical protein
MTIHPNHIAPIPKPGRPRFVPTERERMLVAVMAACGFSQRHICTSVEAQIAKEGGPARHLNQRTLRVAFKKELAEAREICVSMVTQSLFQKAIGNGANAVMAAKYFLILQNAWREPTVSMEHEMLGQFSVSTNTPADKPMLTWDDFYAARATATDVIARASGDGGDDAE